MGYLLSVVSAMMLCISLIYLSDLNSRLSYLYYCVYFSIGYLLVSLAVFTISSEYVDLSKHKTADFITNIASALGGVLFILFISLAHKHAKPSLLGPMWSLVIVFSIIEEYLLNDYTYSYLVIIGSILAI